MTNWTSTDDAIQWIAEVLDDGEFEVQMYYACGEDAVGSTIELRIGEETLSATIETANDSPLIGAEHDRFARAEGYVKNWRSMNLGVIRLRPGQAILTLRATKVTGKEVADMRLLMFRRVSTAR